jgi:hypothetical protein
VKLPKWRAQSADRRDQISSRQRAEELRDAYLPISPEVGRLLYVLARTRQATHDNRIRNVFWYFDDPPGSRSARQWE